MLAHVILYLGGVVLVLGWWPALLFVLLHQTLTGFYLGAIFAPNHKGMPDEASAEAQKNLSLCFGSS